MKEGRRVNSKSSSYKQAANVQTGSTKTSSTPQRVAGRSVLGGGGDAVRSAAQSRAARCSVAMTTTAAAAAARSVQAVAGACGEEYGGIGDSAVVLFVPVSRVDGASR